MRLLTFFPNCIETEMKCKTSPSAGIFAGTENVNTGFTDCACLCVRFCTQMSVELPRRSLSPVLSAVVWTLLSCGVLLALCFFCFTLRFKNNR